MVIIPESLCKLICDNSWKQLARFNFSTEYQKGRDNAAEDALSCVTSKLDTVTMKFLLDGVTVGTTERADAHHLVVTDSDKDIHKQVQETVMPARATQVYVDLHVTNWVTTQQDDLILKTMIESISDQKVQDLKHLLGMTQTLKKGKLSSESKRS